MGWEVCVSDQKHQEMKGRKTADSLEPSERNAKIESKCGFMIDIETVRIRDHLLTNRGYIRWVGLYRPLEHTSSLMDMSLSWA